MARQVVALCDPDPEYALKVANAANRMETRGGVEVVAFSELEALSEMRSDRRPDLFAVHALWKERVLPIIGDAPAVWLTEELSESDNDERTVYKYQAVPQLLQAIMKEGGLKQTRRTTKETSSRRAGVIAIWSAAGGVGKSTLAALLSEELKRSQGGGVFCLSLETGMSSALWLETAGRHDASEWLYELKRGRREAMTPEAVEWDGVESFRLDCSIREFAQLSTADTSQLICRAAELPGCGEVIIDCESGWSERSIAAWEECDLIVCLCGSDASSRKKTERWLAEWPGWEQAGVYRQKSLFVVNKALSNGLPPSPAPFASPPFAALPYVPEWKIGDDRTLDRHAAFRKALLELANIIREAVKKR
jgi:hypothetical protein